MIKIDIYSGFLGAGKTTLIKKLIKEAYTGQRVVLIENEFGEIGIDGGFLADAGVEIKEMNSGCICCSLTGDFRKALKQVADTYSPDRIIIEPSGVGKLSEVATAVMSTEGVDFILNGLVTVVDAGKCKMYMKNFGEFFDDQVMYARTVVLSRSQNVSAEKIEEDADLLRDKNNGAVIMTAAWDDIDGKEILAAIDGKDALTEALESIVHEHLEHGDGECDDPNCSCHHHHDEDEEHECECGHHHHHHDEDEENECECGHHHHDEDEEHECECGHHHHHHDHDADEIFTSWGKQTAKRYAEEDIKSILEGFENAEKYGTVLRAKGIVECVDGGWIHFDYTPGETDVRKGAAAPTGMLCVIGSALNEDAVEESFK